MAPKLLENNGTVIKKVENENIKIKRTSKVIPQTTKPVTALWNAAYELIQNGKRGVYEENSKIRGFNKEEFGKILKAANFQIINYLESTKGNSFLTIARK